MKKILILLFAVATLADSYGQSPAKVAVTQKINDSIRINGARAITAITLNSVIQAVNNVNMDSSQVLNAINAQKGATSGIAGLIGGRIQKTFLPQFVDS